MTTPIASLETAIDGLFASPGETLPFVPSLDIRAFLLRRDRGNFLVYSTIGLEAAASAIAEIGGISRHYLNHRHEALFGSKWVDAPLFVHANEQASVIRHYRPSDAFAERHSVDQDFEVIPTPGHTAGATAYLWDTGQHRMLFTGDTIYLNEGEWIAAVLPSSDRRAYLESLALIRELDFDVLVPWAATRGQAYYTETTRADARRHLDAIIGRVWRGDDH
jgi:glyoxylase-like metal-dependent hydrolase (beta-lactamase superfamily II)